MLPSMRICWTKGAAKRNIFLVRVAWDFFTSRFFFSFSSRASSRLTHLLAKQANFFSMKNECEKEWKSWRFTFIPLIPWQCCESHISHNFLRIFHFQSWCWIFFFSPSIKASLIRPQLHHFIHLYYSVPPVDTRNYECSACVLSTLRSIAAATVVIKYKF